MNRRMSQPCFRHFISSLRIVGAIIFTQTLFCAASRACDRAPHLTYDLRPGLIGEYFSFEKAVTDFPVLPSDRRPTLKRVDAQINFPATEGEFYGTGMATSFFVRWSGWVNAPLKGQYTFYSESDDGSRVFVDGKQVVDNHGLHGMEEEDGDIELATGIHRIKIEFIQNSGAAGCILRWKIPGGERAIIPGEELMHSQREELMDVETAAAFDPPAPLAGYAAIPPEPAENATLDEKVASVLPTPEENQFLSIPWFRNLQEARAESQRQGKPLYLWMMNGAPTGFT